MATKGIGYNPTLTNTYQTNNQNNNWSDDITSTRYNNYNNYDGAQEYNADYGKSFAGIGRFDIQNMIRPSNLTQDLGASTYQAPPAAQLNTLEPNWQHQLRMQNINRGNIDNTWSSNIKNNLGKVKDTIGSWGKGIMDNTIVGRIGAMRDATNPRAGNYNPALQGQIDFMNAQGLYGTHPTSGLPQITGGVLKGQHLQSGFGSNDLTGMYEKSLARTQKTIDNFENQWGNLKEDDEEAYNAKLQIHLNRKKKKEDEFNTFQAAQKKAADERIAVEKQRAGTAPQRGGGQGDSSRGHMGGISQAQADAVGAANKAAGMSGWGLAQGGRAGFKNGEFLDEDINVEGPGFDFNENIEMAGGMSPFEIRIEELVDTGMSWQEAYQIASEEFGQIAQGESDQGIASIV